MDAGDVVARWDTEPVANRAVTSYMFDAEARRLLLWRRLRHNRDRASAIRPSGALH